MIEEHFAHVAHRALPENDHREGAQPLQAEVGDRDRERDDEQPRQHRQTELRCQRGLEQRDLRKNLTVREKVDRSADDERRRHLEQRAQRNQKERQTDPRRVRAHVGPQPRDEAGVVDLADSPRD